MCWTARNSHVSMDNYQNYQSSWEWGRRVFDASLPADDDRIDV
jgi:hypothetical protein